jgi:hypothetical protein
MRFWISVPFIKHTRLGISVSDREIARAFRDPPRLTPAQRAAIEKAEVLEAAEADRRAQAFAARWTKPVTKVIVMIIQAVAVLTVCAALWWIASLAVAHAGTCHVYGDGDRLVEACEDGSFTRNYGL